MAQEQKEFNFDLVAFLLEIVLELLMGFLEVL
jgi:hypothetical protein